MQGVIEVGDLLHPQTKQPQEEEEEFVQHQHAVNLMRFIF